MLDECIFFFFWNKSQPFLNSRMTSYSEFKRYWFTQGKWLVAVVRGWWLLFYRVLELKQTIEIVLKIQFWEIQLIPTIFFYPIWDKFLMTQIRKNVEVLVAKWDYWAYHWKFRMYISQIILKQIRLIWRHLTLIWTRISVHNFKNKKYTAISRDLYCFLWNVI